MDCKKTHTVIKNKSKEHACLRDGCGNSTSNDKFCSRTCSNLAEPRRVKKSAPKTRVCILEGCSNPLPKGAVKFCSQSCNGKHKWASPEKIRLWLAGEIDASSPAGTNKCKLTGWARNYLLEEAKWACTSCGWNTPHPLTGKPPLEIDHIDGNRCNNSRENLVVLCPNCHSLTTTYRRYNYQRVQELKESDSSFR